MGSPLNEKIAPLIKLQEMDGQLDALQQAKAGIVPQREKVQAEIQSLSAHLDETKKSLTQVQVEKKNLELDIEARDQAMRKSSSELNNAKSNEVYKGLLSQIEDAKKAKAELEDKVLELMERMEQLQKESKEREKELQQNKGSLEKKVTDLEAEDARLQGEFDQKKAERDAFAESLPRDIRDRYEGVHRGRRGFAAVVPIKGMICGGCRTTLPPQTLNDVMKGKDIVVCEGCSRILYIPPSEPVAS